MGRRIKVDPFEWEETKAEAAKVPQLLELVKTLQIAVDGLSAGLKGGLSSLSATVANDVVSQNILQNACVAAKEALIKMVVEAAKEVLRGSDVINMEELAEEICKRIDLKALEELVRQRIGGILSQEARTFLMSAEFAGELADSLKEEIDVDTLTEKVAEKVAEKLDLNEIARKVAKHIDDNEQIDLDDLIEKLAEGPLVGIIAGKLNLSEVAQVLAEKMWEKGDCFSYDYLAEKVAEAIDKLVKERVRISFEEKKAPEKEGQ